MTADLLRRAAAKLREHAEAATPGPWATGPSEELPGSAGVWDLHRITVTGKPGTDEVGKPWAPEVARVEYNANGFQFPHHEARNDAAFIALLHPPVALALAEVLEHQADDMADEGIVELHPKQPDGSTITVIADTKRWIRWDWTAAVELSRAVLREEES